MVTGSESTPLEVQIDPDARIHLGSTQRLLASVIADEAPGTPYDYIRLADALGAAADMPITTGQPGMLPARRLAYELHPAGDDLFLEGEGLKTSYGIFGAPGSGKTHLFKHLLRQLLAYHRDDSARKYGALILDPKASLIDDVRKIVGDVNRLDDLDVINTYELTQVAKKRVNPIDCAVDDHTLADLLVLAARSAGSAASENFWFVEWSNLFRAAIHLLNRVSFGAANITDNVVTLRGLLRSLLVTSEPRTADGPRDRLIQRLAAEARKPEYESDPDLQAAASEINRFYSYERAVSTVTGLISEAFGPFLSSKYECYSRAYEPKETSYPLYDSIINDGRIVLVSISPSEPRVAKTLCTLIKVLFQQTVLQRKDRVREFAREAANGIGAGGHRLRNFERPLLLACDEYAEIASEVPGHPMGDGRFFSLSREFGCMGLLATQSVNVLEASSLKESWRSVFSTFGAKVFMRLVDNETAKGASELGGTSDWYLTSRSISHSSQGPSSNESQSLQQRPTLPTEITTQLLQRGDGVLIGSLDGGKTPPRMHFFHVPEQTKDWKEQAAMREENGMAVPPRARTGRRMFSAEAIQYWRDHEHK